MKNVKRILVLMLVTSFTFLASCSKDDNTENQMAFGDAEITIDGEKFTVNDYYIELPNDDGSSYLYARFFGDESTIELAIDENISVKSYKTSDAVYIDLRPKQLLSKNKKAPSYYTTDNHDKTSTIEVLEYNKEDKRVKVKFQAVVESGSGETKTIKAEFYKEFSDIGKYF